jgi:hypothetical protein
MFISTPSIKLDHKENLKDDNLKDDPCMKIVFMLKFSTLLNHNTHPHKRGLGVGHANWLAAFKDGGKSTHFLEVFHV